MNGRTKDPLCVFSALFLTALFLLPSAALALDLSGRDSSRALTVWFESPSVKVKRNDPAQTATAVWDIKSGKVQLSAARAESEGFQAVITVGAQVTGSVSMSALTGAGGTIQTSNIDTFEVRYPTAVNPDWPDPLVPLTFAPTFAAGRNNPYMIDITVPNGTKPGMYFGNITIVAGADTSTVPVQLTVWNITYPKTPSLFTWFDDAAGNWQSYYGYNAYSTNGVNLMKNVFKDYAKYKIQPGNCDLGMLGRNNMTVNAGVVSVDFTGTDPFLKYCLDDLGFRSFRFPLGGYAPRRVDATWPPDNIYYWGAPPYDMNPQYSKDIGDYIKLVADHYKTKGWFNKTFIYCTDEPIAFNDDVGSYFYWGHPNYHVVQQYYNLTHLKAPGVKFIQTDQMVPELWNYTEVWAVPGGSYHELDAASQHALNKTVWWYNTDAGIATPGYEGRALYWDTYARGVDGALYWGTNYWDYDTVNSDPFQGSNSNGDGYLFYPGNKVGVMDNVVPSQRLILARDGIEDYELLTQYGQIYGVDAARAVAESVAKGSFFAGNRFQAIDDDMIYAVRDWLAQQIMQARDFKTWNDTFVNAGNVSSSTGLTPNTIWEGNYGVAYANAPVLVDGLDAIGGWHSNDQANMNSSVSIDTTQKTQGTGSLKIDWWRNNNPGELGGYSHMRNGRVVTGAVPLKDWSSYQILEMDVRATEQVPGSLVMLVGDGSGSTVVQSNLHAEMRYAAGSQPGWRHAVIDISQPTRSNINYIEPIQYNLMLEFPWHHYSYWLDNITVRKSDLAASGTLTSKTIDLGQSVSQYAGLEYISQWTLPSGTTLSFETKTSNDGVTWSQWQSATPSGQFKVDINSPPGRYIQYRATFTSSGTNTPILSDVWINFKGITNVNLGLDNMTTNPAVPNDNQTFNLTARAVNRLPNSISGLRMDFYLGDPDTSGKPVGNKTFDISSSAKANVSIPLKKSPGNYKFYAKLTIPTGLIDLTPNDNKINVSVFVNAYPKAVINAPSWAYINQSVEFNASRSSDDQGITEYKWDFGGGNLTGKVVTYAYNSSGTKTFKLTVKDQHGASANATASIKVLTRNPVPDFDIAPVNGTVLTNFNFTSKTRDPDHLVTNLSWNFGDGNTSYGAMVRHRFGDDRTYNITLHIVFNNGTLHEASVSKDLVILNLPPVANITATKVETYKKVTIGFDGGNSYDLDDAKTELDFNWSFGDGSYSVGETASHGYLKSGSFNVTLTVKDKAGATSKATIKIKILNKMPLANITMQSNATVGDNVTMDGTKSSDPDGTVVNYTWDLGDGSKAYGISAKHAYATAGNWTVKLTVSDDSGATVTVSKVLWIKPKVVPPKPKPKPKPNKGLDMMVVGIAIGLIIAIVAILIAVVLYMRRKKGKDKVPSGQTADATPPGGPPTTEPGKP